MAIGQLLVIVLAAGMPTAAPFFNEPVYVFGTLCPNGFTCSQNPSGCSMVTVEARIYMDFVHREGTVILDRKIDRRGRHCYQMGHVPRLKVAATSPVRMRSLRAIQIRRRTDSMDGWREIGKKPRILLGLAAFLHCLQLFSAVVSVLHNRLLDTLSKSSQRLCGWRFSRRSGSLISSRMLKKSTQNFLAT